MSSPDNFILKCYHLFQTVRVRHGTIVVGPPASSKTSVIDTVRQTIIDMAEEEEELLSDSLYRKVLVSKINPKSITL